MTNPSGSDPSADEKRELLKELLRKRAQREQEPFPLSYGQQALWLLYQMAPDSSAYHFTTLFRLHDVDVEAFERALALFVQRHAALRTTYLGGDQPAQRVHTEHSLELTRFDATEWSPEKLEETLQELRQQPFDLENGPVYRFGLFDRADGATEFLFVVHHIAYDGLSSEVLAADLPQLYRAARSGDDAPPPLTKVHFRDFVKWQRELVQGDGGAGQLAYWEEQLGGDLPVLELPTDRPRSATQRYNGGSVPMDFSLELGSRLRELARSERATLFALVLAGFQTLLHRYSGQKEVLVATPVGARTRAEFEKVIGFFINPIVLRTDFGEDPTFRQVIAQVRSKVVEGIANQDYPFSLLVEKLDPKRESGRNPIFQAMMDWESRERVGDSDLSNEEEGPIRLKIDLGEFSLEALEPSQQEGQVDVALDVREIGDKIYGAFKYDSDLFDRETIERMEESLRTLLEGAAADPDQPVSKLPLLNEASHRQILGDWNATQVALPESPYMHRAFEAQAAERPDAAAVRALKDDGTEQELTYRALNERAERLAHHLQELGVTAEQPVGICVDRSADMMVGLLGILKAGGAYLPLDPAYPAERIAFMLEDSGAQVVISESALEAFLPSSETETETRGDNRSRQTVLLDTGDWLAADLPEGTRTEPAELTPESLAYIIYTSGSTGKPKGVKVPHRAAVNFLQSMAREPGMTADDALLAVTTISFDIHVLELFLPLSVGARVELVGRAIAADGARLLARLRKTAATVMQATPTTWHMLIDAGWSDRLALKALCGGEAMPLELAKQLVERSDELWNMYGPTETTVWSSVYRIQGDDPAILVGRPIDNTQFYIVDENRQPVPIGVDGELYIGGTGVTHGYLDRPELTADRFVEDLFGDGDTPLYRTGDLARFLADGNVQVLGRLDHQIKLRGFRIELGEIETRLSEHQSIKSAVTVVREDRPGDQRLVAYMIAEGETSPPASELRDFLKDRLPDYMVPTAWMFLDEFPLTPNRKVDRKALPAPDGKAQPDAERIEPRSETERKIASIWQDVLGTDAVGVRDNFFDLGGHSLLLLRVHSKLTESLQGDLSVVELFQYPTIEGLAKHLSGEREVEGLRARAQARQELREQRPEEDWIAVVGLAGRFPGANDVTEYWANLENGVESIARFTEEELRAAGVDDALLNNPRYVSARPDFQGADLFDASFFGYSPREAELIDPQQRLFLECSWHALEDAAYDPYAYDGAIGVFAGTGINTYLMQLPIEELTASVGVMQVLIGNDKDFLPTRVSYKLNLRGPSINVQTACSTSLVAVHLACRSLRERECDMAIAGGVTVNSAGLGQGYLYQDEGIASPDGHCRTFDANAQGTLFGDGVGAVVLKRLSQAREDGDTIHAVIRGSAINNDGSDKVGYTAPSVAGQAEVIALALADGQVEPSTVGYIEAHGTGTGLGDPIEIKALTRVMREETEEIGFCGIGSVKSNFGHLDSAAGIAGLMKAILALKHRYIPSSLHFSEPNPELALETSPFYVAAEGRAWDLPSTPTGSPRRAGVSSFGIGGTNCHIVVEEAPDALTEGTEQEWHILPISARSETALQTSAEQLASFLREHPEVELADVAFTLQNGRHGFSDRRYAVCRDAGEAIRILERPDSGTRGATDPTVAFLFPGQGSQYVGMAAGLYESEPVFRREFDRCADGLLPHLGTDLREIVFPTPDSDDEKAATRLRQTAFTQPALFACEYALASLWIERGIKPTAMIGHSIGEYVAACLASVFDLDAALSLVAARGKMMQDLPAGSMLSVSLPESEVRPTLPEGIAVAAANAPSLCALSGPSDQIDALASAYESDGVPCRRLHTSHAFHSQMMDPILEEFAERVRQAAPKAPQIPFISNVTGTWIEADEATDPEYWSRHLREAVRFTDGIEEILEDSARVLLEVGPGTTLSSLTKMNPKAAERVVLSSLRPPQSRLEDSAFLLDTLGRLWSSHCEVDWTPLYGAESRHRISLPTYPFERERYWISGEKAPRVSAEPDVGKRENVSDWFYSAAWKRGSERHRAEDEVEESHWMVFAHESGVGAAIAERLRGEGESVTIVRPGKSFARISESVVELDPTTPADFDRLVAEVCGTGSGSKLSHHIVHTWCVGERPSDLESSLDIGFSSLLHLAKAISPALGAGERAQVEVVADQLWDVTGDEPLAPERTTLLAACKVIPQEYPQLSCRWIDIDPNAGDSDSLDRTIAQVSMEIQTPIVDTGVALRGRHRWVQHYEGLSLDATSDDHPPLLRDRGTYLITGGLGRIGLAISELLAKTCKARLLLTGRTPLPPRDEWDSWLAKGDDPTAAKIRAIRTIEGLGGEVETFVADVENRGQMEQVLSEGTQRFGAIRGVVHAAGQVRFAAIPELDLATLQDELGAKVRGVEVLDSILEHRSESLDFVLLASSLASVLGGIGQAGYTAANLYMDAFAESKNRSGGPRWISLKWDAWDAPGASGPNSLHMSTDEGLETVRILLSQPLPPTQPIISTTDLAPRLEQWVGARAGEATEVGPEAETGVSIQTQLEGADPDERPTIVVEYLTQRVMDLLGHGQPETDASLLHLGLDSLMAVQLRNTLSDQLRVDLPVATFLDGASIDSLTTEIVPRLSTTPPEGHVEEAPHGTSAEGSQDDVANQLLGQLDDLSAQDVDALLEAIDDGLEG